MSSRTEQETRDRRRRPRSFALLAFAAAAFAAMVLGPLAAVAAAGAGSADTTTTTGSSGGSGLVTTSTNGSSLTVGTTTIVATTTSPGSTSTTQTCTGPAEGTVTSTTPTSTTPTTTTSGSPSTTPTSTTGCNVTPPPTIASAANNPFTKRGMWIWELPVTDGGNVSAIIGQAKRYGIGTLYVKSGDGTGFWSQFTPSLVQRFHAAGLKVCAWQYVYGTSPVLEAQVGADAVSDGADCLVIDAETQYQGKYLQAQQYLGSLRARIGSNFPVALAGFPYVDYHPTFPYSVFLGKNGAQYNLPQMYWQDIGTTVADVYAHTYEFNELYQRPIYPLGQIFDAPSAASVRRFRSVGLAYKATGINWWDWQSAGASQFGAIAAAAGPIPGFRPDTTVASLGRGAAGDLVVLAQEHLWNTAERVTIDGGFGPHTQAAVARFQRVTGLPVTGVITPQTWTKLLRVPVPNVRWVRRGKAVVASVSSASATRTSPTPTTTTSTTSVTVSS